MFVQPESLVIPPELVGGVQHCRLVGPAHKPVLYIPVPNSPQASEVYLQTPPTAVQRESSVIPPELVGGVQHCRLVGPAHKPVLYIPVPNSPQASEVYLQTPPTAVQRESSVIPPELGGVVGVAPPPLLLQHDKQSELWPNLV
jgi:hypothetical protein